jgi:hypothetical protein
MLKFTTKGDKLRISTTHKIGKYDFKNGIIDGADVDRFYTRPMILLTGKQPSIMLSELRSSYSGGGKLTL